MQILSSLTAQPNGLGVFMILGSYASRLSDFDAFENPTTLQERIQLPSSACTA